MCIKKTRNSSTSGYLCLLVKSERTILIQKTWVGSGFTMLERKDIIWDEENISRNSYPIFHTYDGKKRDA